MPICANIKQKSRNYTHNNDKLKTPKKVAYQTIILMVTIKYAAPRTYAAGVCAVLLRHT